MIRKELNQNNYNLSGGMSTVRPLRTIAPPTEVKNMTPSQTNIRNVTPSPQTGISNAAVSTVKSIMKPSSTSTDATPQNNTEKNGSELQESVIPNSLEEKTSTENIDSNATKGGLTESSSVDPNGETKLSRKRKNEDDGTKSEKPELKTECCTVCNVQLLTIRAAMDHMVGAKHKKNQTKLDQLNSCKRMKICSMASVPASTENLSESDVNALLYCHLCKCGMNTIEQVEFHNAGKRHQTNLENSQKSGGLGRGVGVALRGSGGVGDRGSRGGGAGRGGRGSGGDRGARGGGGDRGVRGGGSDRGVRGGGGDRGVRGGRGGRGGGGDRGGRGGDRSSRGGGSGFIKGASRGGGRGGSSGGDRGAGQIKSGRGSAWGGREAGSAIFTGEWGASQSSERPRGGANRGGQQWSSGRGAGGSNVGFHAGNRGGGGRGYGQQPQPTGNLPPAARLASLEVGRGISAGVAYALNKLDQSSRFASPFSQNTGQQQAPRTPVSQPFRSKGSNDFSAEDYSTNLQPGNQKQSYYASQQDQQYGNQSYKQQHQASQNYQDQQQYTNHGQNQVNQTVDYAADSFYDNGNGYENFQNYSSDQYNCQQSEITGGFQLDSYSSAEPTNATQQQNYWKNQVQCSGYNNY